MRYLMLVLALVALLTGCGRQAAPGSDLDRIRPPELKVTTGTTAVTVKQGSYCWSEAGGLFQRKGLCADMVGPAELLAGVAPTAVAPGAMLDLRLAEPAPELGVEVMKDDRTTSVPLEAGRWLKAPLEPGIYLYMASARWEKRGSASYVFHVEVRRP